jgi:hypothetical protein
MKNGVNAVTPEGAKVANLEAMRGLCIGHNWAVASEFLNDGRKLNIGALPGGGSNSVGEISDRRNRLKLIARAGALIDRMNNLIDEAVDTDECFF